MTDIKLPQMGESIAEGTIALWLIDVGGYVLLDQPLVQVTTDKADVDIPSPVAGVLKEILVEAGATVNVGTVIARIDETEGKADVVGRDALGAPGVAAEAMKSAGPAEHPLAAEGVPAAEAMKPVAPAEEVKPPAEIMREEPVPAPEKDMSGFFSPAVMRTAMEAGVDLKSVKGTGEGGRVTKADVLKAGARGLGLGTSKQETVGRDALGAPTQVSPPIEPAFGSYRPPVYEVEEGDTAAPFSRLRRIIADHMVYSKRTSPHVTTFAEVDLDKVTIIREKNKARIKDEMGFSLTYLPFVMAAAVKALKDYPLMNSVVQGETILTKKDINLGVAVDSERGLMVPVMRRAADMTVIELSKAVNDLGVKVRDRKITPDELAGGTFTVTNPGRHGNLFGTPIISQPQVGILRMGEVVKRPVVVEVDGEDAIAIRPMMYLSLSYDHRVVDGLTANEFLHRVKEYLEAGDFTV